MLRWVRFTLLLLGLIVAPAIHAAETITVVLETATGQITLDAELADEPAERARGLMYRQDFGPGDAMLFTYDSDSTLSFWMKNTPVSLDIIYFDTAGHWLNTHAATEPFSLEGLLSDGPAQYVLEISAGEAARLGIGEGSQLVLPVKVD